MYCQIGTADVRRPSVLLPCLIPAPDYPEDTEQKADIVVLGQRVKVLPSCTIVVSCFVAALRITSVPLRP